jgi:hypothetical protein
MRYKPLGKAFQGDLIQLPAALKIYVTAPLAWRQLVAPRQSQIVMTPYHFTRDAIRRNKFYGRFFGVTTPPS